MVVLATPAPLDLILAAHVTNISNLILGAAGYGQQVNFTQYGSDTLYANLFGNTDPTNGLAAKFQYGPAATPTTLATIAKAGTQVYASGDSYALTLNQANTTTGKLLELKDPSGGISPLTFRYLNGNPLLSLNTQNTTIIDTATLLVAKTSAHLTGYVMGYFTHVVNSAAADSSGISSIIQQGNSGASTIRSFEAQVVRPTGSGAGGTWGMEVGVHSQVAGSGVTGNVGLMVLSSHAGWLSSGVANDVGLYLGGADGWSHLLYGVDTAAAVLVDISGTTGAMTIGTITSRATDTYNLGSASNRWAAVYTNYIIIEDGLLSSPTQTWRNDTDTGRYRSASNTVVDVCGGSAVATFSTTGVQLELPLTHKAVADPAVPASGYLKAFGSTDGFLYAEANSGAIYAMTANDRDLFLGEMLSILTNTVLIFLPARTDTTTTTDQSSIGVAITHNATVASRLTRQGTGYGISYLSASSQYSTLADQSWLSFGNGAADSPFTLIVLANVTDTAAQRALMSKHNTGNREWLLSVESNDHLRLTLVDESAGVSPNRDSNSAISQGAYHLFGATYDTAAGTGATAANGISLYQDGVLMTSTANNNASYVAMESLAAEVGLGTMTNHTASFLDGSLAFAAIIPSALSATQHKMIAKYMNWYFSLSL